MTNLELAKEQGKQAAPNVIDAVKAGEIVTDITLAEQQGNQAGLLLAENFKGTELYERMKEQGNKAIPLIVDGFISGAGDIPVTESWQLQILSAFTSGNYTPGYTQNTETEPYCLEITAFALMQAGYKLPDFSQGTFYYVPWVGSGSLGIKSGHLVPKPADDTVIPGSDDIFYSVNVAKLKTDDAVLVARLAFNTSDIKLNDNICAFTFLMAPNVLLPEGTDRVQFIYQRPSDDPDDIFYSHLFEGYAKLNVNPTGRGIIPDITGHGHLKYYSTVLNGNPAANNMSAYIVFLILTDGYIQTTVYGQPDTTAVYVECETIPGISEHFKQFMSPNSSFCDADLLTWIQTQADDNNKHAYLLLVSNDSQIYTGTHDIIVKATTSAGIEAGAATAIFG